MYVTEFASTKERGKALSKDITLAPKSPKRSKVFREIKNEVQAPESRLYMSKDVSPARYGVFIPMLQQRYENALLNQDSIISDHD